MLDKLDKKVSIHAEGRYEHGKIVVRSLEGFIKYFIKGYLLGEPLTQVVSVLNAFVIVLIILVLTGRTYLAYAVVGSIVSLAFVPGILQLPPDYHALRRSRFLYYIMFTPLSLELAMSIFSFCAGLPSFISILVMLIILWEITRIGLPTLAIITMLLLFLWFYGVMIGLLVATRIKDTIRLFRVISIIYTLLVYFTPVYWPLSKIKLKAALLLLLSPPAYIAYLTRTMVGIEKMLVNLNILVIFLIIHIAALTLITYKTRKTAMQVE